MIETDRLIIREYEEDDFDDFWEIFSNSKVTASYGLDAFTYKRDAFRFFEGRLKKPFDFAIILKPIQKLIGEVTLGDPVNRSVYQFANTKEMGVIANEKYQKHGYMTEGGKAIIKHCFEDEKLNGIYCRAFSYNTPSIKFSKKCGMKVLFKRMESFSYSVPREIVTSGITKEEYEESKLYENIKLNILEETSQTLSSIEILKRQKEREEMIRSYDDPKMQIMIQEVQEIFSTQEKQRISLDKSF